MQKEKFIILIPAYKPTKELVSYTAQLSDEGYGIVVVNDGSGDDYNNIFSALPESAVLLSHDTNKGKGAALRTGIRFIKENIPDALGIVTADADGQHRPEDISNVAEELSQHPEALILGSRKFDENVPAKSKFGNTLTRWIFASVSGVHVRDTQTGLRAFSTSLTDFMLSLEGDRYEYEMDMLMYAAKKKIPIIEVDIKTVYLNDNAASNFKPLRDGLRIYARIFKFAASSIIAFCIDFAMLFVFKALTGNMQPETSLLVSVVAARAISSFCNYMINRKVVFKDSGKAIHSASKYYLLVLVILGLNYALMWLLNIKLAMSLALAKVITEALLFTLSYFAQKKFVFNTEKAE